MGCGRVRRGSVLGPELADQDLRGVAGDAEHAFANGEPGCDEVGAVRLHGVAGGAELAIVVGEERAVCDRSCAGVVAWRVEPRAVVDFL